MKLFKAMGQALTVMSGLTILTFVLLALVFFMESLFDNLTGRGFAARIALLVFVILTAACYFTEGERKKTRGKK